VRGGPNRRRLRHRSRRVRVRHRRRNSATSGRRSDRKKDRTSARSATFAPTGRHRRPPSRKSRCRIRSCRRPASDRARRAAAQASRSARKTYANVPSPSPEFDRLEPSLENRGAEPDALYSYDESVEEAERHALPQQPAARPRFSQHREPKNRARTGAVFPFKSAIAVGIVLILVGAAILWGKSVVTTVSGLFKPSPTVVEAPKDTSQLSKPKIPDRVGQPSSTDQVAPVAQRVVLYDEDPSDPKGKQYVGSVIWRTEQI